MRKFSCIWIVVCALFLVFAQSAHAATLSSVSDTISTSRPSASAVLSADQAASATQFSVVDLGSSNGNMYIASDSATFLGNTGETTDFNVNYVASMSSQQSGTPNTRTVYMTTTITDAHHKGDPVIVPITAMHTIGFTTVTTLTAGQSGKITITFPSMAAGEIDTNSASPSGSTFQTNAMSSTQIKVWDSTSSSDITGNFTGTGGSIVVTAPTAGNPSKVVFTLNTANGLTGGHALKIFLGCTTVAAGVCTVQSPRLINPNKITTAGTGDRWTVQVKTSDTTGDLDSAKAQINTIEAVQVYASVEPSLTFTISPIAIGTTYNSVASQCGAGESNDTGIEATATVVNLGTLANGSANHAGQRLRVSTNGSGGYVITATSSGYFMNPATGLWLTDANGDGGLTANDTPAPATITSDGTVARFGISPCGARVNTSTWGSSGSIVNSGGTSTAKFSNPHNIGNTVGYYANIASYSTGAISQDDTVVRYAATITGTTPPGIYQNYFSYVATATF